MSINELKNSKEYKYHHTATRRGYESRKGEGHIESYKGRYGKGYIIVSPNWNSTNYVYISYYIEQA